MIINLSRVDFGGVVTGGKSKPEEVFDVQPTTTDQTITPSEGSVFSGGTVRAVTSAIDNNIVPGNIKEGVTILGVAGTLKEEKTEESFDVQPTTSDQTITPAAGNVFSGGTVHAVTSAIDSNIQPENIKEGVSILGVAGTLKREKPEEVFNVQPTTAEQIITPTEGSVFSGGTVHAVTSTIDSNIQPENIKEGVTILGVAGTLSSGGGSDVFVVPSELRFAYSTFSEIPSNWDFSNVTNMSNMFRECNNLNTIIQLDTSNATNMSYMFNKCLNIKSIPQLNTSNVTNMDHMFSNCGLTTIPLLDTSNVTNMSNMFSYSHKLTTIPQLDTSKVTNMYQMFYYCDGLTTIPQLNTSEVTNMSYVFSNCSKLTTIPRLDTSKVTNMNNMLSNCQNLTTVEGIDFSGFTTDVDHIFGYNSSSNITRFIVYGKINVSISDDYSIMLLTSIDYDSVKSILEAANRTDNTNKKQISFHLTMTDQNGELAALVSSCTSKGWTIAGLTLQ